MRRPALLALLATPALVASGVGVWAIASPDTQPAMASLTAVDSSTGRLLWTRQLPVNEVNQVAAMSRAVRIVGARSSGCDDDKRARVDFAAASGEQSNLVMLNGERDGYAPDARLQRSVRLRTAGQSTLLVGPGWSTRIPTHTSTTEPERAWAVADERGDVAVLAGVLYGGSKAGDHLAPWYNEGTEVEALRAYDVNTGHLLWSTTQLDMPVITVTNTRLYELFADGRLVTRALRNGKQLGTRQSAADLGTRKDPSSLGWDSSLRTVGNKALLMLADHRGVAALGEDGSELWRQELDVDQHWTRASSDNHTLYFVRPGELGYCED
jgi:hypothetical protein